MQTFGQTQSAGRSPAGGRPALVAGSKYGGAREQVGRSQELGIRSQERKAAPSIFIPRLGKEVRFEDWYWKELREGGYLQRYLEMEKRTSHRRLRSVAKRMHTFEQNNKSEWKLECVTPAREFFRLKAMDPHFFEDKQNIKNLVRDNPEVRPWKVKR